MRVHTVNHTIFVLFLFALIQSKVLLKSKLSIPPCKIIQYFHTQNHLDKKNTRNRDQTKMKFLYNSFIHTI